MSPDDDMPQPPDDADVTDVKPRGGIAGRIAGKRGPGRPKGSGRGPSLPKPPTSAADVKPSATATHLSQVFNSLSKAVRSEARFTNQEFQDMANSLHAIAKWVPYIAVLLVVLGPLTIVFQVADKIERIRDGRPQKGPRVDNAEIPQPTAPDVTWGAQEDDFTPTQNPVSPFGRTG